MADFHALIKCDDPDRVAHSSRAIAATWVAAGLDTERVTLYRQSDIPEIPELTWLLNCVTAKGLMNRAHAYKATVDASVAAGEEPDANVTMGLFSYPVLMAADILMFNAHRVPVGKDQVQHIEMGPRRRPALQPHVRPGPRAVHAARSPGGCRDGTAARAGRPQDEQEL